MARALEPSSTVVIDAAEVSAGERVVDVATGTGNAALEAAARGAEVIGIDFEPALLELARRRASAAGLNVEWLEGEAEALPVADGQADVVVSVFGSMYAADHAAAARELVRVLAPSGRLVLAAWTPGSLMPAMGEVLAQHLPPPPLASGPPSRWGDPQDLRGLLEAVGAKLLTTRIEQLTLAFDHPRTATDFLIRTAGHVVSHERQLSAAGRWQRLRDELTAFVSDRAEEGADGILLRLDYLVSRAGHS
jgi:SAM-dependent methyltransferase